MVYYFSGTGNSAFVATTLANFLSMKQGFIPDLDPASLPLPEDNLLFVFPVYSWGVPPLVAQFISGLSQEFVDYVNANGFLIDCVMTCGDETGLAPEMLLTHFRKAGLTVNSIRSVIMPNNYVLLPGFNVDPKELEEKKLAACEGRILEIAQALNRGERGIDVTKGSMAWIKTRLIFPLFMRWGMFPSKWRYTESCISCGKCARICPMLNVTMKDSHPAWGKRCCSCLGCYHICPVHAVAYGRETKKKGQYIIPVSAIQKKLLQRGKKA